MGGFALCGVWMPHYALALPAFAASEIPFGNQTLTMISVGLAG
jgi:hypothetical protein